MGPVRGCATGANDEDPAQAPPTMLLVVACCTPPKAAVLPLGVARAGPTAGTLRLPPGEGESERLSRDCCCRVGEALLLNDAEFVSGTHAGGGMMVTEEAPALRARGFCLRLLTVGGGGDQELRRGDTEGAERSGTARGELAIFCCNADANTCVDAPVCATGEADLVTRPGPRTRSIGVGAPHPAGGALTVLMLSFLSVAGMSCQSLRQRRK